MSSDLSKFYISVKAIQTELELLCGQSGHVIDPSLFQKFLYYSIDYVSGHTAGAVLRFYQNPLPSQYHSFHIRVLNLFLRLLHLVPEAPDHLSLVHRSTEEVKKTLLDLCGKILGKRDRERSDGHRPIQLQEWFSLLSDVIRLLFQRRSEWDQQPSLSPKNLISYLSNISFKLMGVAQVPLDWQKLVWLAVLETMLLYSHHPSTGPEFISTVAQQGYKILLTAVKKAKEAQSDSHVNIHVYYEMYLLGSAVANLDSTGKTGNPLKLAKDFLYNYFSSCKSKTPNATNKGLSVDKDGVQQSFLQLVEMAVVVYTLQPRDVAADASLSFYTELFRVVLEDGVLRKQLLACGGNLFRFALTDLTHGFPADGVCAAIERNSTASTVDEKVPSTVQNIVLSILTYIHEVKQITEESPASSNLNRDKKASVPAKSAKKNEASENISKRQSMQDIHSTIERIQAMLKESHGPVSHAISDSLLVLVYSVPRSKNMASEFLVTSIKLISLAVDAFARDILQCASKHSQVDLLSRRLHALGVAATVVIMLLDNLLGRDQLGTAEVRELADMLKSTLQALHCLVEAASSRKVSSHELLNKSVFPVLKKAMSDIGIVGRKLSQQGLHSVAITFLSPLWPVTRMKELLPSISHHVTLCESYLKTSQLKEAWSIISKAVMIDASLVSESVIRILVKVLKQEPSLSALQLFESCQDEDKGIQLLLVVASRLSLTQSLPTMRQASNILRFLVNHKSLSETDRAAQRFFLAQTLWFEADDKTSVSGECLDLLKAATIVLLADTSRQFDDILAQAAFLYWGMLNTLSQLDVGDHTAEVTAGSDTLMPQSSQGSSPQNSSSLRDASEMDVMMQETSLGLDFTPKRAVTMSKRAVASDIRTMCQTDSKTAEQVDSEFLMKKATSCLKVWTAWFTSVGHSVMEDDGMLRMDMSLRFLQKIAELASINYKTTVAVTALCRAHRLASLMKRPDVTRDVMQTLVVLIPQLGLRCAPAEDSSHHEAHGFLLNVPDFEQSRNLLSLTAVAAHHLKAGQLEKFVLARDLAAKMIEDSRRKGLRTCSIYTALAIINRLDAEFHSLPGSAPTTGTGSSCGSTTYPLELAGESLKNIRTVVAFNLGEDFQSTGKPSLEFWRVIHEYLLSVKQYGNLCLHTGNAKYAKTYFTEGLAMARKCLLVTWCAIFSVCLLKLSLLYQDTTSEAESFLQNAVNILKKHKLAVDKAEEKHVNSKTPAKVLTSQDLSRIFNTSAAVTDAVVADSQCSCCSEDSSELRSHLLASMGEVLETSEGMTEGFKVVTQVGTCDRCFQPEIAQLCADLMSSQAEIVWRNKGAVSSVTSTLQCVVSGAGPLMSRSRRKYVQESVLTDSNIDMELLSLDINTDCLPTVDTVYKLAEVKWQDLCCHDGGEIDPGEDVHDIENLLDMVEREGRKMKGQDNSNVLVASALLMRSHLVYQPLLRAKEGDAEDDVVYDSTVIEMAVDVAKKEKLQWDEKRSSWLHLSNVHEGTADLSLAVDSNVHEGTADLSLAVDSNVHEGTADLNLAVDSNVHEGTADLSLAVDSKVNKKSAQATVVSSFQSAADLNGGKIKIVSNEDGEDRKIISNQVGDKTKLVANENGENTKTMSNQVEGKTKLVFNENGDKTEKVSLQSGNQANICIQDGGKVKVLSNKSGNKTEVVSSQSARKKCKSTYCIYPDVEEASVKKPRVVVSEDLLKQNIYSVDNIGVESPCVKDSVLKVRNNKSKDEQVKPLKSRKVAQSKKDGAESEDRAGLSKLPRALKLSNQVSNKSEEVVSKKSRNENGNKAALKNVGKDGFEFGCDIQDKNITGSTCAVLETNRKRSGGKKPAEGGRQNVGKVHIHGLKINQGGCESRRDVFGGQDMALIDKATSGEADSEEDWKNLVEKSKENSRTNANRKGRKPASKNGKKEDKQDDVITPVKDTKTRRTRRIVSSIVESPEAMRDVVGNVLGVTEDMFHSEINAGCFRTKWGVDDDEDDSGMVEDEVTAICHENYTDISLPYSLLPPPAEIEIPESSTYLQQNNFFTAEKGHFSFSVPVEIPRGRPQRRKPEAEVPEKGVSQSGRTGRGRGRAAKKSSISDNHPPLKVSVDIEEKENILLEADGSEETSLPVVQEIQYDQGSQFLDGKAVNVLHSSSSLSLLSTGSIRKTRILQESLSPNIANQLVVPKPTRQKVAKKAIGKQTLKVKEVADLTSADSCSGEETGAKTTERMVHELRDSVVKAGGLQELIAKFPSLAYCQSVTTRIKYLQEALTQLDAFPHSILYRQICRALAMCLWEQDMTQERPMSLCSGQREIAAYLTESMHITFQHLLVKNLHYKLRKSCDKATSDNADGECSQLSNEEEAGVERAAMQTSLNTLTFGGDVMKRFDDRLKPLPADWTIGQITIAEFDPTNPGQGQIFVTRLTSHLEPLTVGIPFERCQFLETALRVYDEAVVYRVENLSPEQHWKHRHQQDHNMQNLVYYLQELFLGGHKWLLRGQLGWIRDPPVQKLLDQAAQDTVNLIQQLHGCFVCYSSVRNILEVLLEANEKEIASLVECVWPPGVARTVAQACMDVQRSVLRVCRASVGETRGPLVLILDNKLIKLPWESMPDLFSDTVTRIPSLATFSVMLTLHGKQPRSPFRCGVNRSNVVAVIPPDTDLQNAVSYLAPQFEQYKGWTCLIQKAPTVSELKSFLTDNSLYIYCGHNWGHQYVGGRDVQLIRGKAVAILMGCSSAKLDYRRKFDGDGGPLYFILAGCPAVMGNLWLVTDKDIDKLTSHLFSQWMSQNRPTSLGQLLVLARKACRLHGLTGFAPVVYGLPVMMN